MSLQNSEQFRHHLRYLVDLVIRENIATPYWLRAEQFENKDIFSVEGPAKSEWITCMNCDKPVSMKDTEIKNTGFVKYLDTVTKTPCCSRLVDKDLCPIVCVGCRRLACFFTPHKNDKGFEYYKGRPYHIDRCNNCDGRMNMSSSILEQVVYNKLTGINE